MDWMVSLVAWLRRLRATAGAPALLLGGLLLLLAAGFLTHEWLLDHVGLRTNGVIETNLKSFGHSGGVYGYPLFRFRLPEGKVVLVQSKKGSDPPEFRADEAVRVRYPASDPQAAVLAPIVDVYGVSMALAAVGVVVIDLGVYALWSEKRKTRREQRREQRHNRWHE